MSRQLAWLVVGAALSLAATGCLIPNPQRAAFAVSEEQFRSQVHTICLRPLYLGLEVAEPELRRAEFEGLIAHRLRRGGFEVVPSRRVQDEIDALIESTEGCFDALTGEPVRESCDQRAATLHAELHSRLGCDALLTSSIAPVAAPLPGDWDGAVVDTNLGLVGWVPAASLRIAIRDMEDRELYWRAGGIEHLVGVEFGWSDSRIDPKPDDLILTNPVRNLSAVLLSLGPLAGPDHPDTRRCIQEKLDHKIRRSSSRIRFYVQFWRARCELKNLPPPPPPEPRPRETEDET